MTKLSVNLNKVALLRNQRPVGYPEPVAAARTVLDAGADGITIHPRPDERHVRRADVAPLARLLKSEYPGRELNIEGNPFHQLVGLVAESRPAQATFVPDAAAARTSEAGWDLTGDKAALAEQITLVKGLGVRVSLFIEADPKAAQAAARLGAQRIEIHTGRYAMAATQDERASWLQACADTARAARAAGLGVNAGHDLTLDNLPPLIAATGGLHEVSIGHAFIADALWQGLAATTRAYLAALGRGP